WMIAIARMWAKNGGHYDLFCEWLQEFAKSEGEGEEILRVVAADMIEAAMPLPPVIRDHVVKDLRRPRAEPIRLFGVRKHMPVRDAAIVKAIKFIVEETDLDATRNDARSGQRGGESAGSIVAKALGMSEANVVQIWKKHKRLRRGASA